MQYPQSFSVSYSEADVRRLCRPGAFARADLLQREGHVLSPVVADGTLMAEVRGTWRRIDRPSVGTRGGQLVPSCSCGKPGFCQHAGALLLDYLRQPSRFALTFGAEAFGPFDGVDEFDDAEDLRQSPVAFALRDRLEQGAESWLALALERDSAPHLRRIAEARGVRLSGLAKAGLVQQLAPVLVQPENIDAALGGLSGEARLALDAAGILSRLMSLAEANLNEAFALLAGKGRAPVDELADRALLLLDPEVAASTYQSPAYTVPPWVTARRAPSSGLVRRAKAPGLQPAPRPLELVALLQVVAQDLVANGIDERFELADEQFDEALPPGYRTHPEGAASAVKAKLPQLGRWVRIAPEMPLLSDATRSRLTTRTGVTAEMVDFAVSLLEALDVIGFNGHFVIDQERLFGFYGMAPAQQLVALIGAWLGLMGEPEIGLLLKENGPALLFWDPYRGYGTQQPLLNAWIFGVLMLLTGLLGRLEPGAWYEVDSLEETLWPLVRLAFTPLGLMSGQHYGYSSWQLVLNRPEPEPINLNANKQAEHFFPTLVGLLLTGPLSWLGLVDLPRGQAPTTATAFRVRPEAGALVGRAWETASDEPAGRLVVGEDLSVTVPADFADPSIHMLLAQAGELVEVSMSGLRYRLTSGGVQALFDRGATGPELQRALEAQVGELPEALRARLAEWWANYGLLRLYDELTVIEVADDVLLAELLAGTSLSKKLIYQLSPRLVAVEDAAVDELIGELTRLGQAPRVLEAG